MSTHDTPEPLSNPPAADTAARSSTPRPSMVMYSERLTPALWIWFIAAVFAAGFGLIVSPHGVIAGWIVGLVLAGVFGAGLWLGTPSVTVTDGELRAGRAHLPLALTGELTALDAAQLRQAIGPGLNTRSYLCIRGWIRTGVRVDVADPADPTPCWLLSSRRPDDLVSAITRARMEQVT